MKNLNHRWAVARELPESILQHYNRGHAAILAEIFRIVKRSGSCSLSTEAIGRLAGLSRSTARKAICLASRNGHIVLSRRLADGDTSVITLDTEIWQTLGRTFRQAPDGSF